MQVAVEMRSRQRSLDPKEIAKEIMNGNSFDQVQKRYGIKMRSQLLDLYTKGLAQLEEIPKLRIASKRKDALTSSVRVKARRAIGASGTITLTRSLLIDELGFQPGDQFSISRQGNTIVLEKVQ
jgi:hypothetical protein